MTNSFSPSAPPFILKSLAERENAVTERKSPKSPSPSRIPPGITLSQFHSSFDGDESAARRFPHQQDLYKLMMDYIQDGSFDSLGMLCETQCRMRSKTSTKDGPTSYFSWVTRAVIIEATQRGQVPVLRFFVDLLMGSKWANNSYDMIRAMPSISEICEAATESNSVSMINYVIEHYKRYAPNQVLTPEPEPDKRYIPPPDPHLPVIDPQDPVQFQIYFQMMDPKFQYHKVRTAIDIEQVDEEYVQSRMGSRRTIFNMVLVACNMETYQLATKRIGELDQFHDATEMARYLFRRCEFTGASNSFDRFIMDRFQFTSPIVLSQIGLPPKCQLSAVSLYGAAFEALVYQDHQLFKVIQHLWTNPSERTRATNYMRSSVPIKHAYLHVGKGSGMQGRMLRDNQVLYLVEENDEAYVISDWIEGQKPTDLSQYEKINLKNNLSFCLVNVLYS